MGVFAREPPVISRQEKAPQSQPIVQPAQGPSSNEVPPPIPPLPPELGGSNTRDSPSRSLSGFESKPPQLPPKPFTSFQNHQLQDANAAPPLPPHPSEAVTRTTHSADRYPQSYYRTMPQAPRDTAHNFSSFQSQTLPNTPKHQNVHPHNQPPNRESYSPVSPLTPERQQTDNSSSGLNTMTAWACCQCGGVNAFHVTPGHCSICAHSCCSNCPMRPPQSLNFQQAPPPSQISFMDSRANHVHSQMNSHYSQSPQGQPSQSYLSPPQQGSGKNQPQIPTSKSAEDLLTSPFDTPLPTSTPNVAPPPIPPNPEKDALLSALSQALTQKVRSAYTSNLAAIPAIHAQQAAMKSSLAAINNEISQLDDLQSLLSANEGILHQAMRDADKVMEDAKHRDVPGVDEVLVAPTVVAGQLYSLVADERSLEECRGVLGKALDKGKIGGDVWAKVRT